MKVAELEGARLEYWYFRAIGEFDDTVTVADADVMGPIGIGWSEIGPLIEREHLCLMRDEHGPWYAGVCKSVSAGLDPVTEHVHSGPTALIAAMRCYVASKFGDEVAQ